jgi:CheY-like chemotaxis protein
MAKGYMRCDDKRRARKAGSDHHLTKPIDLPTLEKVLASIGAVPSRG